MVDETLFEVYRVVSYKVVVKLFGLVPDFLHGEPNTHKLPLLHRRSSERYSTTGYSRW